MSSQKLIQSENNLLLLKYLATKGVVASRKEWAQGTLDWLEQLGQSNWFSNLLTATHSIDIRCARIKQVGSRHEFHITTFGKHVLAVQEPVWIRGKGWFGGFSESGRLIIGNP